MPVTVKIPTPFRKFTEGQRSLELPAGTVAEVLSALAAGRPGLKTAMYDSGDQLKSTVRVFVGEQDLAAAGGLDAAVADGQVISLVPPVAGA